MTIENSIDVFLRADNTLAAALGYVAAVVGPPAVAATPARIYWMKAPELATLPYLVYQLIDDTDRIISFSQKNTGQARYQFSIVSADRGGRTIQLLLRGLLRNKVGQLGTGGVTVDYVEPGILMERYEAETKRFVFITDYIIWFEY